jgi:Pup amidohydrolase
VNDPVIQFGLETEIGIARTGEPDADVVAESIALVRAATAPGVRMRWDYEEEDPHLDMRGFRVRELRQDTDESDYVAEDEQRELSFAEIKSDLVLGNGARFYNDHAHPEYCTPECSTLDELVAHDRAGERILMGCAQHLSEERAGEVRLYKNNTDFFGHSYGCHENYLLPRSLPWDNLVSGILAFLTTRQVFAGAGKFGLEEEDKFLGPGFQISQRADFFSELQSVDTMQRRPLVNTRDEPHANPAHFRRFHVILGDANMSPFATRLRVGSTALVLRALTLEPGWRAPQLADPLATLKAVSRDTTFRWPLPLQGSKPSTAIEVQRAYLELVKRHFTLANPETSGLIADWEGVLDDLEQDFIRCRNRLDWVAKLCLIREFQEAQGLADDDPWLRSLDLEYHRLDPEQGLYYGLEQGGTMIGVPPEADVRRALADPPATTRAYVRGRCVQRFAAQVLSAQWDHITLQGSGGPVKISLLDLFAPDAILRYGKCVDQATTVDDLKQIA